MATRRDPEEWIDPDEFDRATIEAAATDPALADLAASTFTDPHSTRPDLDASDRADQRDDIHRPTVGELLADAAQVDPEPSLDDRSFGGGVLPGSANSGAADDVRLSPDLLPRPTHSPDSLVDDPNETTLESAIEDAFDNAFDDSSLGSSLGGSDDDLDDDLADDDIDDPTDPFS